MFGVGNITKQSNERTGLATVGAGSLTATIRYRGSRPAIAPPQAPELLVVRGNDSGTQFVLTGQSISIGRSETCDVALTDAKCSRLQAIVKHNGKQWFIEDRGGLNPISVNGRPVVGTAELYAGDILLCGETLLQFSPSPLQSTAKLEQKLGALLGGPAFRGQATGGSSKNAMRFVPWILGGLLLVALLGVDPAKEKVSQKSTSRVPQSLSSEELESYLPKVVVSKEDSEQMDSIFIEAFREFKNQNWLRARNGFRLMLQLNPNDGKGIDFLNKTNQEIKRTIDKLKIQGEQNIQSRELDRAKLKFQWIKRFCEGELDPDCDLHMKEADAKLEVIEALKRGEDPTVPILKAPNPDQNSGGPPS